MKPKKRGISSVIVLLGFLSIELLTVWGTEERHLQEEIIIISDNEVPYTAGEDFLTGAVTETNKEQKGYIYTQGTSLFLNGEEYIIQGVCASNAVAASPQVYDPDMMTEDDYREIASLGMNTVRFMMNYDLLEDDDNPYVYKETGWEWIDMNLEWAEKYGLHVIIDCHLSQGGTPSSGANSGVWIAGEDKQERLVAMWRAIAERYCNNTVVLGYGLLNEPLIDTNNPNDWQVLVNRLADAVRSVDSNHVIIAQRAIMEKDRSYVYPVLNDNNWMLEIHEYPTTDMKMVNAFFNIPESYFYYGSDTIVAKRSGAVEKTELVYSVHHNQTEITDNWTEYTFKFTAPQGSNHAYILLEILNLKEAQEIQLSEVSLIDSFGKQIYKLNYNFRNEYTFYSSDERAKIEYLSNNNIIKVKGAANYVAFADNSFFRFFKLEENKEYILKFKLKTETELDINMYVNARVKCYNAEKVYLLNKEFLDYLLNSDEISTLYGVPIYYGEIGIERIAYEEDRKIDLLSYDVVNWLVENKCHFTWFNWHEPNYGIYTSPGLEPKNNPNTLLLEQMKSALKRK